MHNRVPQTTPPIYGNVDPAAIIAEQLSPFEIRGRLLVRNGLLTLGAQALPLVVGLVCVPFLLHGLGAERFGLFVFSWTLTGTLSVLDLGLAVAVTKLLAEGLGRGDRGVVPAILRPTLITHAVLGVLGAGLVSLIAPALVTRFLHVSPAVHGEAILAFRVAGFSLPLLLLLNTSRAALDAAQRFDISAMVRGLSGSLTFLVPLAGVALNFSLPLIFGGLLVARILLLAGVFTASGRVFGLFEGWSPARTTGLRRLFGFGGWIAAATAAGIFLAYGDRYVVGHSLTMADVAYYGVALELISRLGVIAGTVAAVLLPASSTLGGAGNTSRLALLFGRSVKYAALTTVPVFMLLAVFASDLLVVWLGPTAAGRSAPVLRVLTVGAASQVLAVIPGSIVQGIGRPDIVAKFYLLETPLYLAALWWLTRTAGIMGAATAWSARLTLDGLLLLWASRRMSLWSWHQAKGAARTVVSLVGVCGLSALLYSLPVPVAARALLIAVALVLFGWGVWRRVLGSDERRWMLHVASAWRSSSVRSAHSRAQGLESDRR
jgi:O-antigen/teichoic acid export membrane protein